MSSLPKLFSVILLVILVFIIANQFLRAPKVIAVGYKVSDTESYEISTGNDTIDGEVLSTVVFKKQDLVETTSIPMRVGLSFGMQIQHPKSLLYRSWDVILTHPPMGESQRTQQTWSHEKMPMSEGVFLGYILEDQYELVAGPWTFEVWDKGERLFEQTFNLIEPH